ncbi:MAG TPA: ATP-binding protein [Thermoanaerobaculia bacterium]|nr:ATP-binding protein [Thermoanaerobaculia bacterium]
MRDDASDHDPARKSRRRRPPASGSESVGELAARARASEERYRLLFEANPQPLLVFDSETFEVLAANAAAHAHFACSPGELVGRSIVELRPPEDVPALLAYLQAPPEERPRGKVWRHLRHDGRVLAVEVHSHTIRFAGRQATVAVLHDVTARRQLEEELVQAQKMEAVGRLAGGMAHDFNNLLTAITGYCDLASRRLQQGHSVADDLGEIRRAAERAARLTRQLLAFSRKQVLQPEVIDANDVVREVEAMLERLVGDDVRLLTRLSPEAGRVRVDRMQLQQVLLNMAVNARDAMPDGGRLTIETSGVQVDEELARLHAGVRPGPHVVLAVSDTGIGMDAATRKRIFEPFFTTKESGKGTGLGLSMAYGFITQSEGAIWVYSEPGKGTTFKIYLPRIEAPEASPTGHQVPAAAPAAAGGERVLVAEDEPAVRELVSRLLRRQGYRVVVAASGAEALAVAAAAERFDLLVTDVVMADMDGRRLAAALRRTAPGLPVVFMSGYSQESAPGLRELAGGDHFLQKPFTADDLAARVRQALAG